MSDIVVQYNVLVMVYQVRFTTYTLLGTIYAAQFKPYTMIQVSGYGITHRITRSLNPVTTCRYILQYIVLNPGRRSNLRIQTLLVLGTHTVSINLNKCVFGRQSLRETPGDWFP